MLRKLAVAFAALAALFVMALPVAAQQQQQQQQPRIALVIGNAAYPKGPLQTSLADGGLVAEALTSIGFEIVEGADVNQTDLRRVFRDFLEKVQAAGPEAIAFVYYSGYALQFEGDNYLIPVDARLERDSDIPIDGVRLFDLLRPLTDVPAVAKIVVLDAGRPLPFQIQGGQLARGLGAIESAPGMLVAFSSAPGTVAQDGPGPYGAYATAIAEMVREPGLDLDTMFARIRLRTNEATNGAQTPWEVSQLQQVVMLVPGTPNAPPAGAPQGLLAAPQAAMGAPVRRTSRPIRDLPPEDAYAIAVEQDELPTYVEYVRLYPNSPYAQRVWATIRARREALLWRRALLMNSPDAYWTYMQRYPDGMYAFDARRRLRRLAAAEGPPPGFRMLDFDDVPPPVAGEPSRLYDVYPAAPPPRRFLAPPPAFIVGLPPSAGQGGGLWRRQQPAFPMIVNPGPRPGQIPGQFGGRPPGPGFRTAGCPPGQEGPCDRQPASAKSAAARPAAARIPGAAEGVAEARHRHRRRAARPAAGLQRPAAIPERPAAAGSCGRQSAAPRTAARIPGAAEGMAEARHRRRGGAANPAAADSAAADSAAADAAAANPATADPAAADAAAANPATANPAAAAAGGRRAATAARAAARIPGTAAELAEARHRRRGRRRATGIPRTAAKRAEGCASGGPEEVRGDERHPDLPVTPK